MIDDAIHLLAAAAAAFALTYAVMAILLRSGLAARLAMDLPNHRSLHDMPVPRVGGIAVMVGLLVSLLRPDAQHLVLAVAALVLAGISFIDDRGGLPIGVRLATHLSVAGLWLAFGAGYPPQWTAIVLVLAIAWSINLYNFMDGADGLAGGMALLGFAACAIGAWQAGDMALAQVAAAASAAAGAFLFFNFPPARSFLGDVGSVPLGFLAAAVGIEGWIGGAWPLWFPLIVFSPFAVDASTTLLKRVLNGSRFWKAHRDHYYQRLIRMGWSHRRLAVSQYALMGFAAISALAMLQLPAALQVVGAGLWGALYLALMVGIDRRWRQFSMSGEGASR